MKNFLTMLVIIAAANCFAKNLNDDLNGKTFYGTATEITSPNIDRMPIVYTESIQFENGKFFSEVFKKYSVDECNYSAAEDDKRAIALKVISFDASSPGKIDGQDVYIEISGSVVAGKSLSGTIIIHYPDKSEVRFFIEASL